MLSFLHYNRQNSGIFADLSADFSLDRGLKPLPIPYSLFPIPTTRLIQQTLSNTNFDQLTELKNSIQRRLPYVSLTSEAARREILIAPVVLALIDYTQAQLRIEYSINVSDQLKGALDYYLHTQYHLLVIKAKNADLARGFTQLAVELIALDQWTTSNEPLLYGAVSTGDVWQFGVLHREQKKVQQDLNLYRVPADLNDIFSHLVAILNNNHSN